MQQQTPCLTVCVFDLLPKITALPDSHPATGSEGKDAEESTGGEARAEGERGHWRVVAHVPGVGEASTEVATCGQLTSGCKTGSVIGSGSAGSACWLL